MPRTKKRGHQFTSEEAKKAGRKGGKASPTKFKPGQGPNNMDQNSDEGNLTDKELEELAADTRWADDDI